MLRCSSLRVFLFCLLLLATASAAGLASAQETADRLVRDTAPLSPEQQQAALSVPEGFEIQLFAEDGQIGGKPINIAFDARGRLWVSSTREYPYAVAKDRWVDGGTRATGAQDSIRILEDTDGDGRADKVTVFADELNIPTGVLPYGKGCIAWSIPNLVYLEDTDDDGRCDRRTVLFGPLGYEKDTHGMISSLRLGLDGWVYATHGFSNTSHFKARDGSTLDLTSGNVFRFRPDGSRVESWTTGQVNPFGLCWDSWGNLYSADCHSSPIYQLMPGACYPSFGKPHDGLGFAPVMCEHAHGSTGIAGIVYFDGGVWGPDWQDHMLVGNPVTSKVNRDHITFTGSTPKAVEQPDFITSVDPWFRPVDLQLGPDSALYIADFYNRIIGHYEVPLDHPGRDRKSGRIWRVLKKDHTRTLPETAVRHLSPAQLATAMGDANLTRRSLALQETVDRAGQTQKTGPRVSPHELPTITAPPAAEALPAPALAMLHWVRARCGGEEPPPSSDPRVLAHKLRTQAAGSEGVPYAKAPDLRHASPQVLAVALETVVLSPSLPKFEELAEARKHIAAGDVRLAHAWRLAARSVLQRLPDWDTLPTGKFEEDTESELLTVSAAIPSAGSAAWLLRRLQRLGSPAYYESVGDLNRLLAHLARHTPPDLESDLVALVKACRPGDLDAQLDLMATIRAGRKTTDTAPGPAMREWAKSLEAELHQWLRLRATSPWIRSTTATDGAVNPWHLDKREVAGASLPFLSSLPPKGERLTGTLRSPDFVIPEQLTFWIAGHRGPPGAPAHERNAVRLRDAATHKMLAEAFPPREDAPRQVTWEFQPGPAEEIATAPVPPKRGYVEFVDGDSGRAYAWLAAGGFSPKLFELPSDNDERTNQRIEALARLSLDFPSPDTLTVLRALPHKERYFPSTREALATALAAAGSAPGWHALAALAREPGLAQMVFAVLEDPRRERDLIGDAFSTLPRRTQITLATGLAATPAHAHLLLAVAPPQLLADPVLSGKLQALGDPQVSTELARLIIAVPPGNAALDALIQLKLQGFRKEAGNAGRGEALFQTHCAACHRIGVKGNLVGPQLDGIGVRGAERLLEDILDPNRAVDPAFRMHFIKTKDGTVSGGLLRRDLDQQLVLADVAGQEHTVKKADIAEHQESPFSIMPAGFQDLLPGPMLMDLLAYLLERQP